jgi:transcriptional regulator with XRE-family HTH domain
MLLVGRIKTLCQQHNTSIPKLEKELGFSSGSIYKWNTNDPGISKIRKVAEYFDVPIEFLLCSMKSKPELEPFNKQTILKLAKSNNASVGQVIKVLDETKSAILNETNI